VFESNLFCSLEGQSYDGSFIKVNEMKKGPVVVTLYNAASPTGLKCRQLAQYIIPFGKLEDQVLK